MTLALVCYSVYRQTQKSEVLGNARFKLAIVYAVVGLLVGGFRPPIGFWPILVPAISLALSVVVGWLRERHAKVWAESGRVYSRAPR